MLKVAQPHAEMDLSLQAVTPLPKAMKVLIAVIYSA